MENHKIKINKIALLFILLMSIFVSLPLLSSQLDITYDDGIQHICRLMGTYKSIEEGQSFPVIMSAFCNGFGYSWNLFYSPFTAFAPLLFKWIGFSFAGCIKLFMFVVTFFTGLSMYQCVKEISKNSKIAIVAAMLYIVAPYRLTDMYIRYALAELTSFIFLPWIFLGLYRILYQKKKKDFLLAIGTIGLILTHTVITMYTAIFCFIYVLLHSKRLKNKNVLKQLIVNLVFAIVITSFFWMPLLETKQSAEYEVFQPGRMERTEVLVAYKLDITDLLFTKPDGGMIYEIGFLSLIGLALTPIAIKKMRKNKKQMAFLYKTYIFMLIAGIISVIMTLKIFPFEHLPSILKMLQFSFRMLEFSSFFFGVVVAINLGMAIRDFSIKDVGVLGVVLMILTSFFSTHLRYLEEFDENVLWPAVPLTAETGRVHAGMASMEYLPSKAFQNRSYIEERDQSVKVLQGSAQIENEQKENTNLNFEIQYVVEESLLELPYIYYPGYQVILQKEDGSKVELKTLETENGFVGVEIPVLEKATVQVQYTGTWIMKVSAIISFIGLCVLVGLKIKYSPRI